MTPKTGNLKALTFDDLVNHCLDHPAFFEGLRQNPVATLRGAGLKPTPEIITALRNLDYTSIKNVAIACDPVTGPAC